MATPTAHDTLELEDIEQRALHARWEPVMKTRTGITLITGAFLLGCAATDKQFGQDDWYQKTREVSGKAVNLTKSTASASYQRMQKYLKEKEVLKTFHDTGEHSEAAVLAVLHRAGVGTPSRQPKSAKPSPGSGTAKVPGPGSPKNTPSPASPALVPQQYTGDYRWPLDAGIISSEYGERWGKMHKGLDIAAEAGEPVYAVAAGEVIYAGDGLTGYGNVVILRHDNKMTSLYAHNTELKVKAGNTVKQGDLIALLGNTGHSTGPHVHFEFRQGDLAVNPHTLLPKSKTLESAGATRGPDPKQPADHPYEIASAETAAPSP
jgi:murein DD-endopeptidase MepM/ murein hydrolase activator NlpD